MSNSNTCNQFAVGKQIINSEMELFVLDSNN